MTVANVLLNAIGPIAFLTPGVVLWAIAIVHTDSPRKLRARRRAARINSAAAWAMDNDAQVVRL